MQAESALTNKIRLALAKISGLRLFRNHVGVIRDADGYMHRFGLCNGSSDLIGWRSVTVTPEMVGQRVALFVAIEVKTERGRVSKDQQNFIDAVNQAGGVGVIARSETEVVSLISPSPQPGRW